MYRLMFGKRGHKPGRKIVETGECDIGKTFNYRLCLMRHLSKRRLAAEGKLLDYNPCTHCPLIIKAIKKERSMYTNLSEESSNKPSKELIQARRREYSGISTMGICYRCGKSAILEVDTKLCYHCSVEKDKSSLTTAKAGETAECKHCHKTKRIQGRGLCANCYRDISTRNKYPAKNTGRPPKERTPCRGCERRLTTLVDGLCPGCTKIAKNLGLTNVVKKGESKEVLLNQLKVSLEYSAHLIGLLLKKGTD